MSRQIGAALGVAIFVAVMGTPAADGVLPAFRRGWLVGAALSIAAGVVCLIFSLGPAASARLRLRRRNLLTQTHAVSSDSGR
jgi:hypothetical protein